MNPPSDGINELHPDLVRSRTDFIEFVRTLARDFDENRDEWESEKVGDYLEATAAWLEDAVPRSAWSMEVDPPLGPFTAHFPELRDDPSWELFARALQAGSVYE